MQPDFTSPDPLRHLARDVPDEAPRAGGARLAHQDSVLVAAGGAP